MPDGWNTNCDDYVAYLQDCLRKWVSENHMIAVDGGYGREGHTVEKTAEDCIADIASGRLSRGMTEKIKDAADTRISRETRDDGVRKAFNPGKSRIW